MMQSLLNASTFSEVLTKVAFFVLLTTCPTLISAQSNKGKLVKVAEAAARQHTVHILVCTSPDARNREPQLRIVLACTQDKAPNCFQPLAGSTGYMEDLDADLTYEGHNVRVEWFDESDGKHNTVGLYQVQSSSVEKCDVP